MMYSTVLCVGPGSSCVFEQYSVLYMMYSGNMLNLNKR